jgi:methylthioribose-1-phosphate isomerase
MSLVKELFVKRAKIVRERFLSHLLLFPDRINYIGQTALPFRITTLSLSSPDEMSEVIREMKIRGSRALGIAAYLAIHLSPNSPNIWEEHV